MPIITIVEEYIIAALRSAAVEPLEDGTLVATVPKLPGIVVYGVDTHECARELYRLIEDTVRVWLVSGHDVPGIDWVGLSSEKGQIPASYHSYPELSGSEGVLYEDADELERAFEARRKTA